MTARRCKCGAKLPADKRIEFCDACRGKRTKAQDNARKAKQLAELDGIDWAYLGIAVRMKIEEIRANDPRVRELVERIAAEEAGLVQPIIGVAARGNTLRPASVKRILAWLGRPAEDFKKSDGVERARAELGGGV